MQPIDVSDVPSDFICPISLQIMENPVTLCTGQTYDRASIEKWFDRGHKSCPSTMQKLQDLSLTPNHTLHHLIQAWCLQQQRKAEEAERRRLTELLHDLTTVKSEREQIASLREIRTIIENQESLRAIFISNCGVEDLFFLLRRSSSSLVRSEIVSILGYLPLHRAASSLCDPAIFSIIIHVLQQGSPSAKMNAAKLLEGLIGYVDLKDTFPFKYEIILQSMKHVMMEKEHPTLLAAGLSLLKSILGVYGSQSTASVVNLGFVAKLVEILSNPDPRCLELALNALDILSTTVEGREALGRCPTVIPKLSGVLIKVSESCTMFAVSILFTLCHPSRADVIGRAICAELSQKLLMVIQSGCSSALKQRSTELLKLLNADCGGDMLKCFDITINFM